jgi:spermidine/putrescine-binding protein
MLHTLPLTWGLVAIGYDPEKIKKLVPLEKQNSWAILYDPNIVKNLKACGVTLLEDPMDVLMTFYIFQGESTASASLKVLKEKSDALKTVRPSIRRFGTNLVAEQLGNGELCAVMHWNGILTKARAKFQKETANPPFEIILPAEGTLMWIDCVAIPKDAPHVDNAHKFIDFLMRPESAAAITNETDTPTTITTSYPLLKPEIRTNTILFPSKDYMDKVVLPENSSLHFQRRLSRHFASIMTHKE